MQSPIAAVLADRYRIEREIGSGGMATVYLAEDVRHRRRVAIKVLHPELSAVLGSERFLQEIELTANLQHPHILALFDSGEAGGLLYYVMPFVDGETLRQRLERERQLPIPDTVRIATDVADALEYAHRHGVVHRDIKPENILLHDGRPVVADFGIALAVQQAAGSRLTQTGLSLGTPQYMAPEQAMGDKTVDHRADIYALGVVTYEMLAGEPPFTGPSPQAIVAKVVTEKPRPLEVVRDTVPPHVAEAVHSALQKLAADRPASAAAFAEQLREARPRPAPVASASVAQAPAPRRRVAAALLALTGLAGALGAGYLLGRRAPAAENAAPASRLAILAPDLGGTGSAGVHRQLAITPDGTGIVFVALDTRGGNNQLVYQRLDAAEPVPITGGAHLLDPQISTDGRWLIGWNSGIASGTGQEAVVRLPIGGGSPERLPDGMYATRAAFSEDGSIWFTSAGHAVVGHLEAGGVLRREPIANSAGLMVQQVLENGRTLLVTLRPIGFAAGPAMLIDLATGARTAVTDIPVVEIRYTAGYLIHVLANGTMWATPFDLKRREATGAAVQLAGGVSLTGNGTAQLAVSTTGTVAYIPEEPRSLVMVERSGSLRPALSATHNYHAPKFSPDGRRVSVDFASGDGRDVWILSLADGTLSRATFDRDGHDATWMPDGQRILYVSNREGVLGIWRTRPGSSAPPESLLASRQLAYSGVWMPDGRGLLTAATDLAPGSGTDVAIVSNGGRGPLQPVIANGFATSYPALSPDGRWLAYVSNQSGAQQVFLRPLDGTGDDVQVSQTGGTEPVWSADGRELFYRGAVGDGAELVAVELRRTGGLAVVASRRALFGMNDLLATTPHANYDVSPDGRTFAMVRRNPATRIMVLQNLPALVRRLRDAGRSP